MTKIIRSSMIALLALVIMIGIAPATANAATSSICKKSYCYRRATGSDGYCAIHRTKSTKSGTGTYSTKSSGKKSSSSSVKKKYDPYNVYDYESASDFADDKYEEFYDYEDDYEDEDEAYDAAEDYWYDKRNK